MSHVKRSVDQLRGEVRFELRENETERANDCTLQLQLQNDCKNQGMADRCRKI